MLKHKFSLAATVAGLIVLNLIISGEAKQKEEFLFAIDKMKRPVAATTEAGEKTPAVLASEVLTENSPVELTGDSPTRVTFGDLRQYKYSRRVKQPVPATLQALDGKDIDIAGYMIPLNEALDVTEFMLIQVPFFGCCFSVPPEPNETVMVTMAKGKKTDYVYTPIRVRGKFKIAESQIDGFVTSMYKLEAVGVMPASPGDKDVVQHQSGLPGGR